MHAISKTKGFDQPCNALFCNQNQLSLGVGKTDMIVANYKVTKIIINSLFSGTPRKIITLIPIVRKKKSQQMQAESHSNKLNSSNERINSAIDIIRPLEDKNRENISGCIG